MNKTFLQSIATVTAILLLAACDGQRKESAAADVEYFSAPSTAGLTVPFAGSVRVGNMLYLSGNIGNVPGTLTLAAGGIEGETRQTMENIRGALEAAGATMNQVVKCTVFIVDMSEWGAFNQVYLEYFERLPARSASGASGLALGAKVEVECIAAL